MLHEGKYKYAGLVFHVEMVDSDLYYCLSHRRKKDHRLNAKIISILEMIKNSLDNGGFYDTSLILSEDRIALEGFQHKEKAKNIFDLQTFKSVVK